MIKKGLAVIVILLFIGVAFAPSINSSVVKDELVEFDVEFCGLGKKHKVSLTQQEADEVELLFDDIEHQLSEVETREEAEEIFKDAVVELDKYGLLGGLSVRQAQRLVTRDSNPSPKIINKKADDNSNYLCLIAGKTNSTYFPSYFQTVVDIFSEPFFSLWFKLFDDGHLILYYLLGILFAEPLLILNDLINIWTYLLDLNYNLPVLPIMKRIHMGANFSYYNATDIPAYGWLYSFGLNGIMSVNGSFYGNIKFRPSSWLRFGIKYYPAVWGFSGLRIKNNFDALYVTYLGTAFVVKVSIDPPDI